MNPRDKRVKRRFCAVLLACTAIICACVYGCGKRGGDEDAIRATIDKHLQENADLNMSAMDREVKQITVNGDQANAQVEFRLKQGGGTMDVNYDLERQNGQWTVLQSAPVGGNLTHPGMDAAGPAEGAPTAGDPGTVQDKLSQFDDLLKKKGQ